MCMPIVYMAIVICLSTSFKVCLLFVCLLFICLLFVCLLFICLLFMCTTILLLILLYVNHKKQVCEAYRRIIVNGLVFNLRNTVDEWFSLSLDASGTL